MLYFFLFPSPATLCSKPTIPNNSYIIYPEANQVNYTHGSRVFLSCRDGHYQKGSSIMVCNQTVWLKREFSCIGKFRWRMKSLLNAKEKKHLRKELTSNDVQEYQIHLHYMFYVLSLFSCYHSLLPCNCLNKEWYRHTSYIEEWWWGWNKVPHWLHLGRTIKTYMHRGKMEWQSAIVQRFLTANFMWWISP